MNNTMEMNEGQKRYELHFAPLQGYADWIYRNAFEQIFGGVDTYYTPFVRVEKGNTFRNRDLRDLESNKVAHLTPQILPGTADELRLLAKLVLDKGYQEVDINLGCPFPMIIGKNKGSGMLPFPELVGEMLGAVKEFPELNFSVKMRLGWEDPEECLHLLPLLNELPLKHVTLHARVGKQQYKGITNPDAFERFYDGCEHPLFYNGDLCCLEDINMVLERFSRLAGISVGRGLLADPFLASEFKGTVRPTEDECMVRLKAFHEKLYADYGEHLQGDIQLVVKMRSLWEYFLPETDRKLLKKIKKANKMSQYNEAVRSIFV